MSEDKWNARVSPEDGAFIRVGALEMSSKEKIEYVKNSIASYPDFPKPGVLFRDIFSLMRDVKAYKYLMELLYEHVESLRDSIDVVVGLDARGFLFGPQLALYLSAPFVPIRKRGKLPGDVTGIEFTLEYGKDEFQIQKDSIKSGDKAIIIDDLLATGGSLAATCTLLQNLGVKVLECFVIMELEELKGREKLAFPVHSLIQY